MFSWLMGRWSNSNGQERPQSARGGSLRRCQLPTWRKCFDWLQRGSKRPRNGPPESIRARGRCGHEAALMKAMAKTQLHCKDDAARPTLPLGEYAHRAVPLPQCNTRGSSRRCSCRSQLCCQDVLSARARPWREAFASDSLVASPAFAAAGSCSYALKADTRVLTIPGQERAGRVSWLQRGLI